MGVGEPDFPPPPFVLQAAVQAIEEGYHFYTPPDGLLSLKEAVIQKFQRDQGILYTPQEIVISAGAKYLIFQAFLATVEEKDEVVIPTPGWVSYRDIVLFAGGTPVEVPCPEADGFKLSPQRLEEALSPQTKWVILNSPGNPTGAVYSRQELEALGEVFRRFPHVHVLVDDIYETLVYDGHSFCSLIQGAPFLKDRLLLVNGVSKSHSMTGWRIGYGAGPLPLMEAIGKLQSQSTSNPCAVAQKAAEAALRGPQDWVVDARLRFQARRDCLVTALRSCPGLSYLVPQGAFYLYVNCSALLGARTPSGTLLTQDTDVATYCLEEGKVCVVPGSAFGASPFLRLSYAMAEDKLTQAASRLKEAISRLSFP
jgi:aspartate aminotransferase